MFNLGSLGNLLAALLEQEPYDDRFPFIGLGSGRESTGEDEIIATLRTATLALYRAEIIFHRNIGGVKVWPSDVPRWEEPEVNKIHYPLIIRSTVEKPKQRDY